MKERGIRRLSMVAVAVMVVIMLAILPSPVHQQITADSVPPTVPVIRVLAIGDSLTEGLYDWPKTSSFHPYTERLKEDAEKYLSHRPVDMKLVVNNKGKSGERVHRAMVNRLRGLFKKTTRTYDIAIILGGTNDLLDITKRRKSAEQLSLPMVVHDILSLHRMCHWRGVKTAALSIPEASIESDDINHKDFRSNRLHVNAVLRRFAERHSDDTVYIDIANQLPLMGLDESKRTMYWDDGLHFTPAGYDLIGDIVFKGLKGMLDGCLKEKMLGGESGSADDQHQAITNDSTPEPATSLRKGRAVRSIVNDYK